MTTAVDGQAPFRAARALRPVVALFAGGLGLSVLYASTGVGFPCPLRTLTGWSCPLCGGTRMGSALLHGRLGEAFLLSPLAFVALAVVGSLGLLWTIEAMGGPAVRLPQRVTVRMRRISALRWLTLGLVSAVLYTLARNLL